MSPRLFTFFSILATALTLAGPGVVSASPWETLTGCRLQTQEYYDGDSFHVASGGKDKIFRLYAVDTAETGDEFPERVREQEKFFGAKKDAVLAAGKEAEEFARRLLQKPFTVETQWVDAKGNSRQQRFFGKIRLADGSDFGLRLVEAGLARSYGMRQGLPEAYVAKLDRAEASAKRGRLGVWGGKSGALMPEDHSEPEAPAAINPADDVFGGQAVFDRLQQESVSGLE